MAESRIAFDVDLNRIHGYSERDGRVCYNSPEWPWEALMNHDRILIECASPVSTSRGSTKDKKAQEYNRRRWALSNSVQIGRLIFFLEQRHIIDRAIVSPANKWTLQHPEETREVMAGCYGQDNHDIRACRSMLFFHYTNPEKWTPIREYFANL